MLKGGRPVRDKRGKIIRDAPFQKSKAITARVEPNRRWFGNTRTIAQKQIDLLRAQLKPRNGHSVLLRQNKVPLSLLVDPKPAKRSLLESEPFPKVLQQRKRPKTRYSSLEEMAQAVKDTPNAHLVQKETVCRDEILTKGQSKRVWGELHKVVDSADVVLHVLDARDPEGTRCRNVEKFIEQNCPHKHLVFLLNKCVAQKWTTRLGKEAPTLAFHATLGNSFGKLSLMQLLRQYSSLHPEKKQISVGLIGYPNVGKSSVINTLKAKTVCTVAPIPGETKVWQYISLMKRIYLIDCPGVVCPANETDMDTVLRGVVRVEHLNEPQDYISGILARADAKHLGKLYKVDSWTDHYDFLEQICKKNGKLLKGGIPDVSTTAKMILCDWQRGRIPYYTLFDE
ncbi:unnamed protein product [Rotaria socialis]|uniref:Nucleolar GTP-binding protein 2 n=1 Tax=Rotaria socialis TaxID=392032 RepID=A0A818LFM2_9BILA|nr:unnamed protein product [Rotaria socialis]CAF4847640.1 unnamed protein product [Rotaria socialis]